MLILALAGAWVPAGAAPSDRPNLLFLITDQQSAEAMSCRMGREYLHTPAMDRLAGGGMLFDRAYSSNPLCMPWRNSVFTGRYPHETGITTNVEASRRLDPDRFTCFGRIFRDAGYDTAYCGKWHLCLDPKNEASHGFEILRRDRPEGPDAAAADAALDYLRRPRDRPFLLVVSFLNPHNICEWARRLAGREQRLNCGEIGEPPPLEALPPGPVNLEPPSNEPDGLALVRRAYQVEDGLFPVADFTPEDWRRHRWGYYRMIELVDRQVDRVLQTLAALGQEEKTLVVFTSDHGECAGAHRFNQKTVFNEESARVPLILSWKGRTQAGQAHELVNTGVDLLPTLLEAAGLDQPADLPGRSLLPLAFGQSVPDWPDHVVIQNHLIQGGEVDGIRPTLEGRMVRTDRFKYCVYSRGQQRESLVDLTRDPGETTNLATDPAYRAVVEHHRRLLERFGRVHHDSLVAGLLTDEVKPLPFTRRESTP